MNPYDIAREYLNNPYQLEQQLMVARSELRELLFLQAQKASTIEQKAQELTQAAETAQSAAKELGTFRILDTSLLETTGFSLSAAERTAELLRMLCSVPIQVGELEGELRDEGFSKIERELKEVGATIARVLQLNVDYFENDEVNFGYASQEELMQIETSIKEYFKSFNQFQQQMDDWLVKLAPQEALLQIARGYEHFVDEYFEILLQEEKISPGCMARRGVWREVAATVISSMGQYFSDFSVEKLDLAQLLKALDQYFKMINEIGMFLDKPADPELITTYNAEAYIEYKLTVHDFFPIRRLYAIGMHKHIFELIKEYIRYNYEKSEISVGFIVRVLTFVDEYEKLLEMHHLGIPLFKYPAMLKMEQLQTDPPLVDASTRPFMIVLGESTGFADARSFEHKANVFMEPEIAAQILVPLAERIFASTFRDFWENKIEMQEKTQILQEFGERCDDSGEINIMQVFYSGALDLSWATLELTDNFERTIREKFQGVEKVAFADYQESIQSSSSSQTNVAADFNTIFQANAVTATFSHPEAGKIALSVIRQASAVIVEFCTSVYKLLEVALPFVNYQCFFGQAWRNYFSYQKNCKNAVYASVLAEHAPTSLTDFQYFKELDDVPHAPNMFDNLNEHELMVVANDAYNMYSIVRCIATELDNKIADNKDSQEMCEEYVEIATKACIRLIVLATNKIAFLTIQELPLSALYTQDGDNFWFEYRKILLQTITTMTEEMEAFALKELKRQLYLSAHAFEFTAFLFETQPHAETLEKNCASIDNLFKNMGVRKSDIERHERITKMFVSEKMAEDTSFLERCIFTAYSNGDVDEFVTENMRSIELSDSFYSDLSALERAVKRYKEG